MNRQGTFPRLRDLLPDLATPLEVLAWLESNEMSLLWVPVDRSSQPTLWQRLFRQTGAPGWGQLWQQVLAHPVGRAYLCEHFRDTMRDALRTPEVCARPLYEALGADVAKDWWADSLSRAARKGCEGDEGKALSEFLMVVAGDNRLNQVPGVMGLLGQWGWLDVNAPMRFSIVRNSRAVSIRAQAPVGIMLLWLDQMSPTYSQGRWQKPGRLLVEATFDAAARLGWVVEASPLSSLAGFELKPHEQAALDEVSALARQQRLNHALAASEDTRQATVLTRL